ncbi:hypothetical protein DL95DRAFT_378511 [Leptodontidium sp. 2 PMI_412]|nr:hypothetical protein DL95DRAFT_378511 [Leptodontidium sp. 2 PMI_412]
MPMILVGTFVPYLFLSTNSTSRVRRHAVSSQYLVPHPSSPTHKTHTFSTNRFPHTLKTQYALHQRMREAWNVTCSRSYLDNKYLGI